MSMTDRRNLFRCLSDNECFYRSHLSSRSFVMPPQTGQSPRSTLAQQLPRPFPPLSEGRLEGQTTSLGLLCFDASLERLYDVRGITSPVFLHIGASRTPSSYFLLY
ncbi:hypothetical protein BC937DRAFT_87863 [Endogone sp. FLAS-F59071]|nr:hypothetical protein BC937DRAFT_87863 [Endogone sp. FLAS-F59071]|eukprot:RUS19186.1 hypothetical protein BC937DRAFT_87863 [Endogone sp. FLAS-F59071]